MSSIIKNDDAIEYAIREAHDNDVKFIRLWFTYILVTIKGFSITIFAFGISGTIIGFYLSEIIPPEILRIIIFVTPLYILLLVINAKQTVNRLAVVIGGTISPIIYPITNNWSILFAGIIGGSAAILIINFRKKFLL